MSSLFAASFDLFRDREREGASQIKYLHCRWCSLNYVEICWCWVLEVRGPELELSVVVVSEPAVLAPLVVRVVHAHAAAVVLPHPLHLLPRRRVHRLLARVRERELVLL